MALNAGLAGQWRLVHRDANANTIAELLEKHTSEFGGSGTSTAETDPQKMVKVKKQLSTIMKEDDMLVTMFKADGVETTGTTASVRTYRIPVTFRNVRTKVRYEKTLIYGDFAHYVAVATNNAYAAGVWNDMDYYSVPAQSEVKLGHDVQDVRVDSAMNIHEATEE
jgi:hypothetical protein